ncbi:MAG: poly-gamma-glutamate system protein [Firmicutes bacterium]|nr:poly-gamma-glutamate system protein [Bacillota bacterium]
MKKRLFLQGKTWFAPSKKNTIWLPPVSLVIVVIYVWASLGRVSTPTPYYEQQIAAAQAMARGMAALVEHRKPHGPALPANDLNETGLIGVEHSPLTTTLAPLWVKLTTANPDMAALMVRLLWEAGVGPKERVAVGLSGSFPALNLALITALDALEIEGVIISSLGSSTWGANHPDLTWPDMETILYKKGIIKQKSIALSPGGSKDLPTSYPPAGQEALRAIVKRWEGEFINTGSLEGNVERRLEIYGDGPYAAYVNIGGSLASVGSFSALDLKPGVQSIKLPLPGARPTSPLEITQTGIVINLLDVGTLALHYGLPLEPYPLPPIGKGAVYTANTIPVTRATIALLLSIITFLLPLIFPGRKNKHPR